MKEDLKARVHRLVANEEPYDYKKICEQAASDVGLEKRQEFMDRLWSGMKLGDARDATGISLEAALGTINRNIEKRRWLRHESL